MNRPIRLSIFLLFVVAITSCKTTYQSQSFQYKDYRVTSSQAKDAEVLAMLKPYSDSVNKSMNEVVGVVEKSLEKKPLEGSLGNFMVDAFYTMGKEKLGKHIDVAFMNYGGIRLTQLAAGEVTRGKIFELMPFDNVLIIQEMKGSTLQQVLDKVAAKGGWPVAGLTMQIKDKKAVNIIIQGKPLDPGATYSILNSDYVANGGDDMDILKVIPQYTNGYLMRDALFDYIARLKSQGKNISANVENRVTNAN